MVPRATLQTRPHLLMVCTRGPGGAARQEAVLVQEGVHVGHGPLGERTVDFASYGWFPAHLPSEESEDEDE